MLLEAASKLKHDKSKITSADAKLGAIFAFNFANSVLFFWATSKEGL